MSKQQQTKPTQKTIKCVVVGDAAVGKTSLLVVWESKKFPEEYVPTIFDNFESTILYKDQTICLSLWDTAGQDEYNRLRVLSYPDTQVFCVCFSLVDRKTLEHVKTAWKPELDHHCPGVPIVLVGTKLDMREESKDESKVVTTKEGEKMREEIGAFAYLECSAKTQRGLQDIFRSCIEAVMTETPKSPKASGKPAKGEKDAVCCVLL